MSVSYVCSAMLLRVIVQLQDRSSAIEGREWSVVYSRVE